MTHSPVQPQGQQLSPGAAPHTRLFGFDGGAGTWLGVQIAGVLVTVFNLGICYPWAIVMTYR